MIPPSPFYIIRHGQTEANLSRVMSGHVDTPLTDTGIAQAEAVAQMMNVLDPAPEMIVHSTLSRARDTAKILNRNLRLPMQAEEGWREQHYGAWQGADRDEVLPLNLAGQSPPGGERNEDFQARVLETAVRTLGSGKRPLIVCHGGVIRALGGIYKLKVQRVANCRLYEFQPDVGQRHFPWQVSEYDPDTRAKTLSPGFQEALRELTRT